MRRREERREEIMIVFSLSLSLVLIIKEEVRQERAGRRIERSWPGGVWYDVMM